MRSLVRTLIHTHMLTLNSKLSYVRMAKLKKVYFFLFFFFCWCRQATCCRHDYTFFFPPMYTSQSSYMKKSNKNKFQVFSEASILFSVGGKIYSSEPLTYTYMEDKIFETSRNVSIKLHRRVGRFIKLRLSFAAKWIMISEITFDSSKYTR